jgi:hypothetical protein
VVVKIPTRLSANQKEMLREYSKIEGKKPSAYENFKGIIDRVKESYENIKKDVFGGE